MIKFFERNSTSLTISEFYDNYITNKYNFDVGYQRKSNVWSEDKQSFLIDSILKNYPIPAIFLRPKVDNSTGKTVYDVVDGKQRLQSIISFIENRIPLTSYFAEDILFNNKSDVEEQISGLFFEQIKERDILFSEYIKQFWIYKISIEYLYEDNEELISCVFDRLNRNGEPLTQQELRNAKYNNSMVLLIIKQITEEPFWQARLTRLKSERMETEEFISELFFMVGESKILDSSPRFLDELYDKYSNIDSEELAIILNHFNEVTGFVQDLNLDFNEYKRLNMATHIYGLFAFAWYCEGNGIKIDKVKGKLKKLYTEYFGKNVTYAGAIKKYKDSASSRTNSESQRKMRLNAMLEYCGVK